MKNLELFYLFLIKEYDKQSTIRNHLGNIKRLLKKVPSFSYKNITSYLLTLKLENKSPRYLNNFVCTIRIYARFANLDKKLQKYPFFKEKPALKATMSDEEIEAFLRLPPPTRKRIHPKTGKIFFSTIDPKLYNIWTLFFSIMAYTGMRPGEVAHLKIENVDFGRNIFILEDTKTNQPRFVPIPENLKEKLKTHIKSCRNYLFPSRRSGKQKGKVFDNVDWHYNFHTRIKRLGIKRKNLTPYSLRHSFITRMLEEDVNIFKVQKIVGHRQLNTTMQYTHLTTKDLQNAIKKHPLVRKSTNPRDILKGVVEMLKTYNFSEDKRFYYKLEETAEDVRFELKII